MHDLGLILRNLREQRGYTQEQLGKKINKGKAIISRYESNYQLPTLETLICLAKLYNVSLDYLAGIKPSKTFTTDNLTSSQEKLINELIFEFNRNQLIHIDGLSKSQLEILNQIIIEFERKKSLTNT